LKNVHSKIIDIKYNFYENLTLMEISRDMDTLSGTEITLTIKFLKEFFKDQLVIEYNGLYDEDDLVKYDEDIGKILE